jgi:hypothetical protein
VSGYSHSFTQIPVLRDYPDDIYFSRRISSWGWATWKDRWDKAEWDMRWFGENMKDRAFLRDCSRLGDDFLEMLRYQGEGQFSSWAVRWNLTCLKNKAFCVYPRRSLVRNIGLDDSGVHSRKRDKDSYHVDLLPFRVDRRLVDFDQSRDFTTYIAAAHRFSFLTRLRKIVKRALHWIILVILGVLAFLAALL